MHAALLTACAVLLDLFLGDPRRFPHPVRAIGAVYAALDALADRKGLRTRFFGALCVLVVAGASGGIVYLLTQLPGLGWVLALYFAYAGLALGELLREGRRAARFLIEKDIEAARTVVAGLVSRDVDCLDTDGLWRALAESVAENANDAFVAPLFWLALGGPGILWAYKAVSTADSMWGYRTERYRRIGWFGARADDVLAYLPARLTALAMVLAAAILGMGRGVLFRDIAVDAKKSASPNAGWPMAAAAWLCGGGMGGETVYFGKMVEKPRLGPTCSPWNAKRFSLLSRLVLLTGFIVAVVTFSLCTIMPLHWHF
jgi:adenosylcobinamide-phosphate synthase